MSSDSVCPVCLRALRVCACDPKETTDPVPASATEAEAHLLRKENAKLIEQIEGFAMRFSVIETQVENLIEDNKELRALLLTVKLDLMAADEFFVGFCKRLAVLDQ